MELLNKILLIALIGLFSISFKYVTELKLKQLPTLEGNSTVTQIFSLPSAFMTGGFDSEKRKGSHVGTLEDFQAPVLMTSQSEPFFFGGEALSHLAANKKIDSYFFTFYNWYRIQIHLKDMEYESSIEMRFVTMEKGSNSITQNVGFSLPNYFYRNSKAQNQEKQPLQISFKSRDFSINVTQFQAPKENDHEAGDGYLSQEMLYLSENFTDDVKGEMYGRFISAKTITHFEIDLKRKDFEVRANLTHVIRHDQCITDYEDLVLRHKCLGGYGFGKLNFNRFEILSDDPLSHRKEGTWHKNTLHLNCPRTRASFLGYRSTRMINRQYQRPISVSQRHVVWPKTNWVWKSVEIDFVGFNKAEYYAKKDDIEKERWVGMSISQNLKHLDPNSTSSLKPLSDKHSFQAGYLFVNGHVHELHGIDFNFSFELGQSERESRLYFRTPEDQLGHIPALEPHFSFQFYVFSKKLQCRNTLLHRSNQLLIDGYWSGWVDERVLSPDFSHQRHSDHSIMAGQWEFAEFYNITGSIRLTEGTF